MKRCLIGIVLVLLTQVLHRTEASCSWSSETGCIISCTSGYSQSTGSETPEQVMGNLQNSWNERLHCHADGIDLTLQSGIVYPNWNVQANWFTAQVKVKELIFGISGGSTIEANAFNSSALKSVTKLTFPTTSINLISKGIFNGLESLEELTLRGASLKVVQMGVLDALHGTLKRFTLTESSSYWSEILIDGFTGSEQLTALTHVKYTYNLKTTLSRLSFAGLENVIVLDLSECQIQTIGIGAFDSISNSIEELNLKNNQIKTLPDGLFHSIVASETTKILMDGNKWECECDLMPFKIFLIENRDSFLGSFICNLPTGRRGHDVIELNFCPDYDPPPTTTRATTIPTTTTPTTTTPTTTTPTTTTPTTTTTTTTTTSSDTNEPTTPEDPDDFEQLCYESSENDELSERVSIKAPRVSLTINENSNGDITAEVDKTNDKSILIWFSRFDRETIHSASDEITCLRGVTNSIPIRNLREETSYTFCLMDSTERTVSPLDCISYTKGQVHEQTPWLLDGSKSLTICMVALGCCVSLCIGVAIGFFALNQILKMRYRNQNVNVNACINDVMKETFQSNSIMRQRNRISNMTISSDCTKRMTNSTVDYYIDAPPLPARPPSLLPIEEPIYAVVRDFGTLKRMGH